MERVAVMGAGALGMLLAGKLASAGYPAVLWTRSVEQARLINERGISVEETSGPDKPAVKVKALPVSHVATGFAGTVMIALKQTAINRELLAWMQRTIASDSLLVGFQNGT